ncbi:MAG: hypothetical protein J1E01_09935 [Acetatifactor sp.]|nr:hypothetical protein [Acetatifactor sp.]
MSKTTKIVTIVLLVVITGVVGVFAFLSDKDQQEREAAMTQVEKVLNRDLSSNYPGTPREVIRYYVELEKCFYADDTTDEDLEALGMRARELYDKELLEINGLPDYLINLKADVERFKGQGRKIVNVAVASSINVDTFQEDGYEFARLTCSYNIIDEGVTKQMGKVYLLRRDENRLWKIYGWDYVKENTENNTEDNADNVNLIK